MVIRLAAAGRPKSKVERMAATLTELPDPETAAERIVSQPLLFGAELQVVVFPSVDDIQLFRSQLQREVFAASAATNTAQVVARVLGCAGPKQAATRARFPNPVRRYIIRCGRDVPVPHRSGGEIQLPAGGHAKEA